MDARSTSEIPKGSPNFTVMVTNNLKINEPFQSKWKKKTQFLAALADSVDTGASLSGILCETMPEIKHCSSSGPCDGQFTSHALDNGDMDLHFLRASENSSSNPFSNHQMWEHELLGNKVHTYFSPNTDCARSKVEYGDPLFTFSNSSISVKSAISDTVQLEKLLVSPGHSTSRQSSQLSMFVMGDELSAALASGFRDPGKSDWQTQKKENQTSSFNHVKPVSSQACSGSVSKGLNLKSDFSEISDICSGLLFLSETKEDHLLEALVAGVPSNGNPNSSYVTVGEIPSQFNSTKDADFRHTLIQSHKEMSETAEASSNKGGCAIEDAKQVFSILELHKSTNTGSTNESTSIVQNLLKDDCRKQSEGECPKEDKQEDTSKTARKRGKTGETPRPRPKDRQQIQDRVRELREIVPNGNKCSIDALLERTIKYIKFLHTVTQHVGMWHHLGKFKSDGHESKTVSPEESKSGASWAVDLGPHGELQGRPCPIIVENLNQPGQMLVEILCEEKGIFLEIADNIRGLGLTIVRGVMEVRNENIWGRFVVEAVRNIHRMEVLWSLAQILELAANHRTNKLISN
eukprot:Gb_28489 [translate_table: standard]